VWQLAEWGVRQGPVGPPVQVALLGRLTGSTLGLGLLGSRQEPVATLASLARVVEARPPLTGLCLVYPRYTPVFPVSPEAVRVAARMVVAGVAERVVERVRRMSMTGRRPLVAMAAPLVAMVVRATARV
jgi:hypothetical protein